MHSIALSGNEEVAVRLGAALVFGGILGLNREAARKTSRLANSCPGKPRGGLGNACCARIPEPLSGK